MACFLVPTAEAIVVTAVTKIAESKKQKDVLSHVDADLDACLQASGVDTEAATPAKVKKPLIIKQLKWLCYMLWGGSALLCFEHIWHGEVVPWFPFLTAASDPTDKAVMLHEMGTAGVSMAILVSAVWVGIVLITNAIAKRELVAQD